VSIELGSKCADGEAATRHPEANASSTVNDALRVLYVDHTAALGGGELALLDIVRKLDPHRVIPVVLLFAEGPLAERLRQIGVETHILQTPAAVLALRKESSGAIFRRLRTAAMTLLVAVRVARWIKRHRIDIVHTNSLKSDVIGGVAARLARKPLVWHVRDRIDESYLPLRAVRVFRQLARWLPHGVIANSASTLSTLRLGSKHATVVYSGVDLTAIPKTFERLGDAPCIGLVGRISRWKGQHVFLRAAAEVLRRVPSATFAVVGAPLFGEEGYEAELHRLVKDLGIADSVIFTGFRHDIFKVIGGLDVLVHASITEEPFGQVVIQGMACGKPVVATRGGGVEETVVHEETGLLVKMGDVPEMADAILSLIADRNLAGRLGRAGRERVKRGFTIEHTVTALLTAYDCLPSVRPVRSRTLRANIACVYDAAMHNTASGCSYR
jgi:glycosyltransferase involved in cell wall biosynthesis